MSDLRDELLAAWVAVRDKEARADALVAEHVGSRPWLRIAKSADGIAVVVPAEGQSALPDLSLEHLRVRFNLECSIEASGVEQVELLSIVECLRGDKRMTELFLDVVSVVLPLSVRPTPAELQDVVSALAELFRSVLVAGPKSTLGLWGELFAMAEAGDPAYTASAWHITPRDRYDFASGPVRVEVKTATALRAHHFSLDQLRPPDGVQVVVESIVTTPSPAGPSIQELLDTIAARTRGTTRTHLIGTAMRSLGNVWTSGANARFDADLARSTMCFFASPSVPRVSDPPLGVSAVKFVSDLTSADAMTIAELRRTGPLGVAFAKK